jgi:hypothetical protein
MYIDISEERIPSAFRLRGLLFDPEDGGITFFRNVGKLLSHYTASYPRRQFSSSTLLIQKSSLNDF